MKAYQFQIELIMHNLPPQYKFFTGLNRTYKALTTHINSSVCLYLVHEMDIKGWRLPTYQELRRVYNENATLDYTIECVNSEHNTTFRVTRKEA